MNEREIFQGALDLEDPASRQVFLDQNCAGNEELRSRIEALLRTHERDSNFLKVPAAQQLRGNRGDATIDLVSSNTSADDEDADLSAPDIGFLQPSPNPKSIGRLGHYEILEILGHGGFGIVFKAFDESLHRVVAIKAMNPQLAATSPPRKRFLREARSVAAIKHENIVQIYSVEEQPLPYLVMEYIDGQTLQQRLEQAGPLEIPEILHFGRQMASGLAAAHARGVIHRDIKPGNILLEQGDEQRLKITDFGLARAADDASMTRTGTIAGTPMYMAPEQALGQNLDHRADLFSLGSVLYQMASGRPPFRAASTIAVLKRVVEDSPRPIQEIIPSTPDWLSATISKLHAKRPDVRFQTAREVVDLLTQFEVERRANHPVELPEELAPFAITTSSISRRKPASKPVRLAGSPRKSPLIRRPLAMAAAVLFVLLSGLGLTEATGITNARGTVIRLFSPSGTLVVEVDDPAVSVSINGEDVVITGTGAKEIRLKPGPYDVRASKNGEVIRQELVTVTKNGRQIVRISRENESLAVSVADAPSPSADPDRQAAEWILSIGGKVFVDDGYVYLTTIDELPPEPFRLTMCNLDGNRQVDDAGLAYLKDCKSLTNLSLRTTRVTDAGLSNFSGLTELKRLDLGGTKVSDIGIACFEECKKLTDLDLERTLINDAGLAHFRGCENLLSLSLSGTRVTDAGLANFKDCKGLVGIMLYNTKVTDAGLENFKNCPKLIRLYLQNTAVTDVGMRNFEGCTNVQDLFVGGTQVGDVGLAFFQGCTKLTHLDLRRTRVSDEGLASFRNCVDLKILELPETQIGDQGLAHLQGCTKLEQITLGKTKITDAGLAVFRGCAGLTQLDLAETAITDASAELIAGFAGLKTLHLEKTKITPEKIAFLQQAIPKCRIYHDRGVIEPLIGA